MYCKKCGQQIANDSTFCNHCGAKLKFSSSAAGIRKAIKEDARKLPKGKLSIGIFIIFIFSLFISYVVYDLANVSILEDILPVEYEITSEIIKGILCVFLMFGITIISINITRGKKVKTEEIFSKPLKNKKGLLYYFISYFILIAISLLLAFLINLMDIDFSWFLMVPLLILIVLYFYIYPLFDMFFHLCADDKYKKKSFSITFKDANKIIKGNRVEYYAMLFSFVGWILLSILTLGVLLLWVYPYMILSTTNLYRRWKGEVTFDSDEKGMSNEAIIGTTVGIFVGTIFLLFCFIAAVDEYDEYDDYDNIEENVSFDGYANLKEDDISISFRVPYGFEPYDTKDSSHKEYSNEDGDYIYYYLAYSYSDFYETEKKISEETWEEDYKKIKLNEYSVRINNLTVNAFSIDYKEDGYDYRVTYAFYPVNEDYTAVIILGIEGINKNNLSKYLKVRNEKGDRM